MGCFFSSTSRRRPGPLMPIATANDDDNDGDGTTGNGAMGYNDDDNGDG